MSSLLLKIVFPFIGNSYNNSLLLLKKTMNSYNALSRLSEIYRRRDFYELVFAGKIPGYSIIQKFGSNDAVGTTLVPVCTVANYQMETTAKVIEINSTDANDTAAGTGAQSVIAEGLDANFAYQSSERALNGLAVVNFPDTFTRIFRMRVGDAGAYATQALSSNLGDLIASTSGGGALWAKIGKEGTYGLGQSEIGWYTIPKGKTGFLWSKFVTPDIGATDMKVFFFRRDNCNVVVAPFSPIRLTEVEIGIQNPYNRLTNLPKEMFPEYTDMGFMAKVSASTAGVSVAFEILLIDNDQLNKETGLFD